VQRAWNPQAVMLMAEVFDIRARAVIDRSGERR
jgi:hypothetical protein